MSDEQPVKELCDQGHYFYKLPDHPKDHNNYSRCPYCMDIGLRRAREEFVERHEYMTRLFAGIQRQMLQVSNFLEDEATVVKIIVNQQRIVHHDSRLNASEPS